MRTLVLLLLVPVLLILAQCTGSSEDTLLKGFSDPPAEARPFVRWWWNGNRITEKEITRQLDVFQKAGIGGIEINPIAFPEEADTTGTKALRWLSPEWNQLLALASGEASKRGLITDLIVGSGWPFGGEFLKKDETVQRIIVNSISQKGGGLFETDINALIEKAMKFQSRPAEGAAGSKELFFIDLVPDNLMNVSDITDLKGKINEQGEIKFNIPEGNYHVIYGILQKGYWDVMHGAPGAAGPVMDHYRKNITIEYLNRLKKISEDTGIPLNKLIRALFCDSIELAGANWTDGFADIFFDAYGYRPEPWLPFIFYESYRGYPRDNYDEKFSDQLKRVRYDYNKLLVKVFLDNFTRVFQDFCTENGLKCRYQAYGTPFLMGMTEGNMIADIPESNNWIYSVNMDTDEWIWSQDHGYIIWNLYASSGGHLTGRKIISCEAMTNTSGVFRASLEEIKRHDDMNFITGINHSILHGYNYSPMEAGFPGWIRYGGYFSEQNTWWPYFSNWTTYNARLSYIFQQSKPVRTIAVIVPAGDIWSEKGLPRVPFHKEPWYAHRIWEPVSQSGSSCDYINESIIVKGVKENGTLKFGPMTYQAIVLCNVRSIEPATAKALFEYVSQGGKLVVVDGMPHRSLSMNNAVENDSIVVATLNDIQKKYPGRIFVLNGPESPGDLLKWGSEMLEMIKIDKDVNIKNPDKNVFQIRQVAGDRDIWFFVNSNRADKAEIEAVFPARGKTPCIWNPETGMRKIFPYDRSGNELVIELDPLESLLLVFEKDKNGERAVTEKPTEEVVMTVPGPWEAEFAHFTGRTFRRSFNDLQEFGTSGDDDLKSFAGTVKYLTVFESDGSGKWLKLEKVNKGITEVIINGKSAGINWYGKPVFRIDSLIHKGSNSLEVKYTSVLSNYVMTLNDKTSLRWTKGYEKIPVGLEGKVMVTN